MARYGYGSAAGVARAFPNDMLTDHEQNKTIRVIGREMRKLLLQLHAVGQRPGDLAIFHTLVDH